MWLSNSSIGRKVVMSVTGIALVLFLTFHMAMNLCCYCSRAKLTTWFVSSWEQTGMRW